MYGVSSTHVFVIKSKENLLRVPKIILLSYIELFAFVYDRVSLLSFFMARIAHLNVEEKSLKGKMLNEILLLEKLRPKIPNSKTKNIFMNFILLNCKKYTIYFGLKNYFYSTKEKERIMKKCQECPNLIWFYCNIGLTLESFVLLLFMHKRPINPHLSQTPKK